MNTNNDLKGRRDRMLVALQIEWLKFHRAKAPRAIAIVICIAIPTMTIAMVLSVRNSLGGAMAGKVAGMMADQSMAGQLGLAAQMLSVFALLGGGFVASWICGREFSDRTIGGLFALPIARGRIALAKLIIAWGWASLAALLAAGITIVGIVVMNAGAVDALAERQAWVLLGSAALTAMLSVPFGLVASLARGYLVPTAALIGTVAVTQLLAAVGGGSWFPFAIPALWSGAGGPELAAQISLAQLATVPLLAIIAAWITMRTWDHMRLD